MSFVGALPELVTSPTVAQGGALDVSTSVILPYKQTALQRAAIADPLE